MASGSGGGSGAGGRAGGGAPAAQPTGGRGGGGIPLDFRRGKTSKKLLDIEWVYPVWKPVENKVDPGKEQHTVSQQVERALSLEEAYALVTDGDRRPVLILRECERCKGTDHALLSQTLDNEQTVLLAHWFRCVKLPPNVLTEKHPFYNLFKRVKEGDKIPHLFFCDPDGSNRTELPGDQPQSQLWVTMFAFLDRCYAESAKEALKEMRQVLGQYDKLDIDEKQVKARMDKEIEKNGPESDKLKKFDAELAKIAKEREKLTQRTKELRELALKSMPPQSAAPAEASK